VQTVSTGSLVRVAPNDFKMIANHRQEIWFASDHT
jgi:hypothetical protein